MAAGARRVSSEVLAEATAAILRHAGLGDDDARLAADVLVSSDLRGVDTHGVSNMLGVYVEWLRSGHAVAEPAVRVVRESPGTMTLDGDRGLGVVVGPRAMDMAIAKAAEVGVGIVTVGNSRHLGMAAYHAMLALDHDMIGVCTSAVGPIVVPTFGREPRLGTNPIAVAVPSGKEPPFVFDAAMSAIAGNRVTLAHRLGVQLPPGVVADEDGTPVMAPSQAAAGYADVKLLPLGSTRETGSHKGYGLAVVVEVLGSVLSGSELLLRLGQGNAAHFFMALDIAAFTDVEAFRATMDDFVVSLRTTPPAPGHDRVLVAGLPEWEQETARRREGIPLHPDVVRWFDETSHAIGEPTLSARIAPSCGGT